LKKWLQIDERDNIAVALSTLAKGELIQNGVSSFSLSEAIQPKHKFALKHIGKGEPVYMYGIKIGKTLVDLNEGDGLSIDNLHPDKSHQVEYHGGYEWKKPSPIKRMTEWKGYRREDGKYGTRNHWLVIPLVFCENHHVEMLRETLEDALGYTDRKKNTFDISELIKAIKSGTSPEEVVSIEPVKYKSHGSDQRLFENVDGIKFITHHSGCGGTRRDSDMFVELVVSYLLNPNCAGATILSLGCQNAQLNQVKNRLAARAENYKRPIVWLEEQNFQGEDSFLKAAVSHTLAGLMIANRNKRTQASLADLSLGLECGGSDGFSGITANPLLGRISDQIVADGGISILSEFPELNGVEENLVNRCTTREQADRFVSLMKSYEKHVLVAGSNFDANPSPGNIREGLLTGAMKSAGAARKAGSASVTSVLDYTEIPTRNGLHLLCTPGNDVESTTALAGSGANLIVFTTGLGTPTGNPLTPVIKMSSNTTLALKMPHLIDFDAGPIVGGKELNDLAEDFLSFTLKVASGQPTRSEENGQDDFIPWKRDISL
jgi:altronate hydrolase